MVGLKIIVELVGFLEQM